MARKADGLRGILASVLFGAALMMPLAAWAGGGGGGFAGMDPQQLQSMLRDRYLGQYKTTINFTDDEWSVVEPKMWKVAQLQIDTQTGGLGSLMTQLGGGGGRGRGGIGQLITQAMNANGQPSQVQVKRQAMQDALAVPDTPAPALSLVLSEYREAMKKALTDLTRAQEDLRGVVTIRQEAMLVEAGFLD